MRDNTWYAERQEELRVVIQKVYDENNQIFGAGKITAILKEKVTPPVKKPSVV